MFGDPRHHFACIDSTNIYARHLISQNAVEGTAVTTDFQTKGRGRLDRGWESNVAQNLLVSYIIYPPRQPEDWGGIPLFTGIAVNDALVGLTRIRVSLKWPNDVMIERKKIAGILVESGRRNDLSWAIIGIGVNVNQTRFEGTYIHEPISIALQTGRFYDIDEIFMGVSQSLERWYYLWLEQGNPAIIRAWKERTEMLGKDIIVNLKDISFNARAIDLDISGSLMIEKDDGAKETLYSGDVRIKY